MNTEINYTLFQWIYTRISGSRKTNKHDSHRLLEASFSNTKHACLKIMLRIYVKDLEFQNFQKRQYLGR